MHIALNAEMKNGVLSHFSYEIKEKRTPRSEKSKRKDVIKRSLTKSAASLTRKAEEIQKAKEKGEDIFSPIMSQSKYDSLREQLSRSECIQEENWDWFSRRTKINLCKD